jgi:membrane-associated phospholipid phosphatase
MTTERGYYLKKIPRHLPRVTFLGTKGFTVFESFPSGDAAGAMVFTTVLAHLTDGVWWAYAPAVLASYVSESKKLAP